MRVAGGEGGRERTRGGAFQRHGDKVRSDSKEVGRRRDVKQDGCGGGEGRGGGYDQHETRMDEEEGVFLRREGRVRREGKAEERREGREVVQQRKGRKERTVGTATGTPEEAEGMPNEGTGRAAVEVEFEVCGIGMGGVVRG